MSAASVHVLVVDDDPGQREMLAQVLAGEGREVATVASGEEALAHAARACPDLVLLDVRMPGLDGLATLAELRRRGCAAPTVMMTAFAEVEDAVAAMKLGAADYLRKPIDLTDLLALVERHAPRDEAASDDAPAPELPEGLVFESPLMRGLLDELRRVAASSAPVLLTGESGTGKEVLAELLHRWGPRPDGPLVRVNVAALPAPLLESELFGHAKGAFTGAQREREGLVAAAHGGTLFLDELGELPLEAQPKLLRVLESGEVLRVGSTRPERSEFRLVAATNRDLEAEVAAGRFRQDLYYRVAVVQVEVPPLRERPEDVLALARGFLREASSEPKRLSPDAERALGAHAWPGNVRELRNAVLRAAILAPGERVLPEHLPPDVRAAAEGAVGAAGAPPTRLEEIERRAILDALERCGGNRTHAARELGISRRKLLYRLKDYGVGGAE